MEKIILVSNIGSSSKKYALYKGDQCVSHAHFERSGEGYVWSLDGMEASSIEESVFKDALTIFLAKARTEVSVEYVGVRVVSSGTYFREHHVVTAAFLKELEQMASSDPAHIAPILGEIRKISECVPQAIIIAVSDSAFHRTLPQNAHAFALPKSVAEKSDVYHFGFHGLSLASVVRTFAKDIGPIPSRAIVCHLGSGSSITALRDGVSVETSMGYSALSGLVMSSRVGDIDAGAVLRLLETYTAADLQKMFYTESGLLAISGFSNDMRELLKQKGENEGAQNAIDAFVYAIQKYIGAYAAVLGGVDAVIFSGMIGERSAPVRERVCERLAWLGVSLDKNKNSAGKVKENISDGKVAVYIVPSDEAGQIAFEVAHMNV